MKAILLAGGKGTRLRPLTVHTPKPIVPIFDRPFLRYQIDLVRQVPEIDEIILSLNYQPGRIEEVFGDGSELGVHLRYVIEPTPLGTGGAIKFAAGEDMTEPVIVFNGDVLMEIDLPALIALHRERQARATIVLTPVPNPAAYGLVETDAQGNILAFIEKPDANRMPTNTINAGVYVLEPETFDRIPRDTAWSIERKYFPSLIERGETFVAHTSHGYWIDIGTREKYLQVHRDIMSGAFRAAPFDGRPDVAWISPDAEIDPSATIQGPCFIDAGTVIKRGAVVRPYSVIGRHCHIDEEAVIDGAILWSNTWVDREAVLTGTIAGRHCHFGRSVATGPGSIFGDKSVVTDYSKS